MFESYRDARIAEEAKKELFVRREYLLDLLSKEQSDYLGIYTPLLKEKKWEGARDLNLFYNRIVKEVYREKEKERANWQEYLRYLEIGHRQGIFSCSCFPKPRSRKKK